MTHLLLLASLIGAPPEVPADTLTGILEGRVWSAHSSAPLPRALLELRAGGEVRYAVADEEGDYRLEGVPPGIHVLRAMAIDHSPLQVTARVSPGALVSLDFTLDLQPIGLPPLHTSVSGLALPGDESAAATERRDRERRETELRALEASPGMAELGLGQSPNPPGDIEPDPSSMLYVRGAASDLKLVLLDGAPVYAPFHLGGLMDAFQPGVLRSADLWVGGAPARFDGGLSYVLDLRTRTGRADRVRSSGAVDLLGARARVEGPVGPGSFLVGGRGVHGALHEEITGDGLPYGYRDGLARVDVPIGSSGAGLSATAFHNRETVSLDGIEGLDDDAYWGNAAGSVRWYGPLGAGTLELVAATGNFSTRLPLLGDTARIAEGSSVRSRVEALYRQHVGDAGVEAGLAVERLGVGLVSRLAPGALRDGVTTVSLTPPLEFFEEVREDRAAGYTVGTFADMSWSPFSDVDLRGGLRADAFLTEETIRLAPRVGAAWRASEETTLSLAAGRFHQYVRAPETVLASDLDGWSALEEATTTASGIPPGSSLLAVVGASHLVMGLENQVRQNLSLGVEAFLKSFDGLPSIEGLRASGADIWVHRTGEGVNAWLGYTIAFAWTESDDDGPTERFAGRHLVSGGLGADLPSSLRTNVTLSYGSGLPFTPIPRAADAAPAAAAELPLFASEMEEKAGNNPSLAGAPAGSYLRLDARISRTWTGRFQGADFALTPYVMVLNALDRRDALFYHFDPHRDLRPKSLAAVPVLPVVGVEWNL